MVTPARLDISRGDTELVFTAGTRELESVLASGWPFEKRRLLNSILKDSELWPDRPSRRDT